MTLEQIIRYAITCILSLDYINADTRNDEIQDLLDILVDFGSITGENLKDLLKKDIIK